MNMGEAVSPTPIYAAPAGREVPFRVVLVAPARVPGWILGFQRLVQENDWIDLAVVQVPGIELPLVHEVGLDMRIFLACERAAHGQRVTSLELQPLVVDSAADSGDAAGEGAEFSLHKRISALRPDLVLLLGPETLAYELAAEAPWGCWRVDASLADPHHAGLPLIAAMVGGDPTTRTELVLQGRNNVPVVLAGSWGRTRSVSFLMQRDYAFRKLAGLLLRSLRLLAAGDLAVGRRTASKLQLHAPQDASGGVSGARAMAWVLRSGARALLARHRKKKERWMVILRQGVTLLDPEAPAIDSHAIIEPPSGWWADPFPVAVDGRRLVFVEEVAAPVSNKGTIACFEIVEGAARRLGTVLEEAGHLSFPQAFSWEGHWYMTVESSYARRVSLYRASSFPLSWVRVGDIITDRRCVDPTLYHHDGHWYLFANVSEADDCDYDDLFLFVADALEGPYRPHPCAPVVEDVRRARLAGGLFHAGGKLIRPAQDCAPRYGNAVVFNEVLELSPTVYRERAISRLAADWSHTLDGCHTYNVAGSTEVLDIRGQAPRGAVYLPVADDAGSGGGADHARFRGAPASPAATPKVAVSRGDRSG